MTQKSLDELLVEIHKKNTDVKVNLNKLSFKINAISNYDIQDDIQAELESWSDQRNNDIIDGVSLLLIAILIKANEIAFGYKPRESQLIALLILLTDVKQQFNNNCKGLLAQIRTGEGKTMIIAFLAAYKALMEKQKVDIITTSPVLAIRDASDPERRRFYKLLGLTVDHADDPELAGRYKKCYEADIVYGSINELQADQLRHSFAGLNVRGLAQGPARSFQCVIIDEVDSMLLDDTTNCEILMLSNAVPATEYLNPLFTSMWNLVTFCMQRVKTNIDECGNLSEKMIEEISQQALRNCIDNLPKIVNEVWFESTEHDAKPPIPNHLKDFIKQQLPVWSKSLHDAILMCENINYVIRGHRGYERIMPVDYTNTGIIKVNNHYEDGLHQFLQLKHKLKLSPYQLTTSFDSSMDYVNRYNQIYGVTGTLGSVEAQNFLRKIYNVRLAFIPTFCKNSLRPEKGVVLENKESWLNEISTKIESILNDEQSVLVIAESIADIQLLNKQLRELHPRRIIVDYFDNTNINHKVEEVKILTGSIILATNLAGRGTDLKLTKKLKSRGGLVVLVLFMPANLRVERQAFGRTARQGDKGTCQMMLNWERLEKSYLEVGAYQSGPAFFDKLMELRNQKEKQMLTDFLDVHYAVFQMKTQMFGMYCKHMRMIKDLIKDQDARVEEPVIRQLNEFWGFHFDQQIKRFQNNEITKDDILIELKTFLFEKHLMIQQIFNKKLDFFENTAYVIHLGYYYLHSNDLDSAEACFKKAIELDDNIGYSAPANYYLALVYIQRGYKKSIYAHGISKNRKNDPEMLEAAKIYLKQAVLLANKLKYWISSAMIRFDNMAEQNVPMLEYNVQIEIQVGILEEFIEECEKNHTKICECDLKLLTKVTSTWSGPKFEKKDRIVNEELEDFIRFGLFAYYDLKNKKPPRRWLHILYMTALGLLQVGFGILCTSLLPELAIFTAPLIYNGIEDIFNAINAAIFNNSQIDFSDWSVDKLRSYACATIAGCTKLYASIQKHSLLKKAAEQIGIMPKEMAKPLEIPVQQFVISCAKNETIQMIKKNIKIEDIVSKKLEQAINNCFDTWKDDGASAAFESLLESTPELTGAYFEAKMATFEEELKQARNELFEEICCNNEILQQVIKKALNGVFVDNEDRSVDYWKTQLTDLCNFKECDPDKVQKFANATLEAAKLLASGEDLKNLPRRVLEIYAKHDFGFKDQDEFIENIKRYIERVQQTSKKIKKRLVERSLEIFVPEVLHESINELMENNAKCFLQQQRNERLE